MTVFRMRHEFAPRDGAAQMALLELQALGPTDRVAVDSGPVPIDLIKATVGYFRDEDGLSDIVANRQDVFALGRLTPTQVEAVITALAESGLLEDLFGEVPGGRDIAPLIADKTDQVQRWLDAKTDEVRASGSADLADGWGYVQVHTMALGLFGPTLETHAWRITDLDALPAYIDYGSRKEGIMYWPAEDSSQARIGLPELYLEGVRHWLERGVSPVLQRDLMALAAWRSGCDNIRLIASALGVDRKTVYSDLRKAGIEPKESR